MSDWDDLFRAAKGIEEEEKEEEEVSIAKRHRASFSFSSSPHDEEETSNKHDDTKTLNPVRKKKQKIKRSKKSSRTLPLSSSLDKILNSRMDDIQKQIWTSSCLPSWLSIGSSLCSNEICQGWTVLDDSRNNDVNAKCQTCGWSMLHHALKCHRDNDNTPVVSSFDDEDDDDGLELFVLVRNIRCCCSCILEHQCQNVAKEKKGCVNHDTGCILKKKYVRTALKQAKQLLQIHHRWDYLTPQFPGEAEILKQKLQNVYNSVDSLHDEITKHSNGSGSGRSCCVQEILDTLVQVMIDCDLAYFRLYYLQNAGIMAVASSTAFVPHPVTYFGTVNLTWSVDEDCLVDFFMNIKSKSVIEMGNGGERWNDILTQMLAVVNLDHGNDNVNDLDPMSYLHRNRMMETIYIFWKSGWIDSSCESWRQLLGCIRRPTVRGEKRGKLSEEDSFYEKHSTPAPKVLQDWRDCCRDLLCNLYAYATLSPTCYREVVSSLQSLDVSNILEMGAGTGYIALQFKKMGLDVEAFDLAPTRLLSAHGSEVVNVNEYHGSSPPYYHVQPSGSNGRRIMNHVLGRKKGKVDKTALLLCYPPPLSTMAQDILQSFVESGGKVVVHIGEFKGLTGSKTFERMISKQFRIAYRSPCLHWGTDAATVTIWKKLSSDDRQDASASLLLPCSCCGKKESRRRFRIYRPLVYCSEDCYKVHARERSVILSLFMVPWEMISELNDVDDYDHRPHLEAL